MQDKVVKVSAVRSRLRLVWSWAGQRYFLYLGLDDTKINRVYAQGVASQIYLDLLAGHFDQTLAKYKPQLETKSANQNRSVFEIFEAYLIYKSKRRDRKTIEKYQSLLHQLQLCYGCDRPILHRTHSEEFFDWLSGRQISSSTIREKLQLLTAAWRWAIAQGLAQDNFWLGMSAQVLQESADLPDPFTTDEVHKILAVFRDSKSHYYDYVRFLFGTGCRIGEANGLRWRGISADCSLVSIFEAYTDGQVKQVKNKKPRQFRVSDEIRVMLLARRNEFAGKSALENLVFTSVEGAAIDARNFLKRVWTPALRLAGVPYKNPYKCRHTFISHCLESGMSPVVVARLAGHDLQTLYQSYAGIVDPEFSMPSLYGGQSEKNEQP